MIKLYLSPVNEADWVSPKTFCISSINLDILPSDVAILPPKLAISLESAMLAVIPKNASEHCNNFFIFKIIFDQVNFNTNISFFEFVLNQHLMLTLTTKKLESNPKINSGKCISTDFLRSTLKSLVNTESFTL